MLQRNNISYVFHYAPLHYLVFIARAQKLLSKGKLSEEGFNEEHFRSTSKRQDRVRGFNDYIHLSIDPHPGILLAKLKSGFPHFEIEVPASVIESYEYHLCRFNIAKARYFRGAKQEPMESEKNGKYYGDRALPIAVNDEEKDKLIFHNYGVNMIEVLVPDELLLTDDTIIRLFSQFDYNIAKRICNVLGVQWKLELDGSGVKYGENIEYRNCVTRFLYSSLNDLNWFGDGLEFDRV